MQRKRGNGAIQYIRVSTRKQTDSPLNLDNQAAQSEEFIRESGWQFDKAFIDPGESGTTMERPKFLEMVAYAKANPHVGHIVVSQLDRFARNQRDYHNLVADLWAHGIELHSAKEPEVNNRSAKGRYYAGLTAAEAQHFSDRLSERMSERSKAAVMAGRYPRCAPLGYINIKSTGANIAPDPATAQHVKRAFEMIATGRYSKAEVLRILTAEGFKNRRNKPVPMQTFEVMLTNPIYCGRIRAGVEEYQGLHEALITAELFDVVQAVLSGKKPKATSHARFRDDLPLKVFVRCGDCKRPMTGGFSTGNGKKKLYGQYRCRNPKCRAVKMRKEKLEREFLGTC